MNIYDIPILVISLKKDIARKTEITAALNKLGLKFDFIDAVYGKNLTQDEINSVYYYDKSLLKRKINNNEIGCALSHFKAYEFILQNKMDKAIILEDDAIITEKFIKALGTISYLPVDWELLSLGGGVSRCRVSLSVNSNILSSLGFLLCKPLRMAYRTHAYVINDIGAKKLLKYKRKIKQPIDLYTGNYRLINLYMLYPSAVKPNLDIPSNIRNMIREKQRDEYHKNKMALLRFIDSMKKSISCSRGWFSFKTNFFHALPNEEKLLK